MKSKLAIK